MAPACFVTDTDSGGHNRQSASRAVAALVLLATAVGLAGCGGSSKSNSSNISSSFAASANRVCANAGSQAGALPAIASQSFTRQLDISEQQNAISRDEAARLRAIAPPNGQQAAYQQYLSHIDRRNSLDQQIIVALRRGQRQRAKTLSNQAKANSNAAEATSLGLTECAKLDAQ